MEEAIKDETKAPDIFESVGMSPEEREAYKQKLRAQLRRRTEVMGLRAPIEERRREIMAAVERISRLPVLDDRPVDELLSYNEDGLFE